jgi:hypothetical protein
MEQVLATNTQKEAANNIETAIALDQNAIPYTPQSTCPPLGTLVPLSMYGEIVEAQANIADAIGESFDSYVQKKLKYSSKVAMCRAFSAEQIDAIAMAIYQIENKKGLIVADMAGVGKGRVGAGLLRYGHAQGLMPVFITEKSNLFSDLYRDLYDIGGFHDNKNPVPFIVNGHVSGGSEIDEETGEKIKNEGQNDIIMDGKVIFKAQKRKEVIEVIKSKQLPKEYSVVLSTYDQFSAGKPENYSPKMDFMYANADRMMIVLDEAHNAAGSKSKAGLFFSSLVSSVTGCLFMSATFAKRPDNIFLYVNKTDIVKSTIPVDAIILAVQKGGDKLVEYLSGALARSGQLIRRTRSFANCGLSTRYTEEEGIDNLFNQFDLSISSFLELLKFCGVKKGGSGAFAEAKRNAVERFAKKNKVTLADISSKPKKASELEDWYRANQGKYMYDYYAGNLSSSLFHFVETLLFSLKAELVARSAISEITTVDLPNNSAKGTVFLSNRKPIIAVRSTLENIYHSLNIKLGEEVDFGDFSKYILSLVNSSQSSVIRLKEVHIKDFEERGRAKKGEKKKKYGKEIKEDDWKIESFDYKDNGAEFQGIYDNVASLKLDLPLSPIDTIIDAVEATKRNPDDKTPHFTPYLNVGEVTGRKYRFVKLSNGKYILENNKKEKNKFKTFSKFNNGMYDMLLINESGSTGASAHSSPLFADSRPRSMIIHQVELDINTEVQKRGRINRTGQLYYPTYIYAVSRIPSEIRRLNMMARKMRTLDATTSANQKQSSAEMQILDRSGNPIQDLINKYGYIALQEFLSDSDNSQYLEYMPTEGDIQRYSMDDEQVVVTFLRNIELLLAEKQEIVYDTLNSIYISEVEKAKAAGTYTEETEVKDLKATPKNRVKIKAGEGTSPFNESVFEEDNYINREDRPLSKDEIEELSLKLTGGVRTDKWHADFLEKFESNFKNDYFPTVKDHVVLLDLSMAENELERQAWDIENKEKIKRAEAHATEIYQQLKEILTYFTPLRPVKVPEDFDVFFDSLNFDGTPDKKPKIDRALGVFVGYKITDNGSLNKYSPMNIELIFAQLTGTNKVTIKPTSVRSRPNTELLFDIIDNPPDSFELKSIGIWSVDTNERVIAKFLTGNILDAFEDAKLRTEKSDDYKSKIEFVKFTTYPENTIRLGLRLFMYKYKEANPDFTNTLMPINSASLIPELAAAANRKFEEDSINEYDINLFNAGTNICLNYYQTRYGYKRLKLYIFGGLKGSEGKDARSYINKKLYNNDEFWSVSDFYVEQTLLKVRIGGTSKTVNAKFVELVGSDEDEVLDFRKYLDYIFDTQGVFVNLSLGETKESLYGVEDIYSDESESESKEQEGIFKYYLIYPYAQLEEKLQSFAKFVSYERSDIYSNGIVVLNRKPSMKEVLAYSLAPTEVSPKNIFSNIVSLLTEKEKIDFVNDLKEMAAKSESPLNVYLYIEKLIGKKVFSMQQVFGIISTNLKAAGQLLLTYIISPESAEAQAPIEVEAVEIPEEYEVEKISLNLDTAQDFLILMNYNM